MNSFRVMSASSSCTQCCPQESRVFTMGNTIFGFLMIGFLVASLAHFVGCLILSFKDYPKEAPLVTVREEDPPEGDEEPERNLPEANVQGGEELAELGPEAAAAAAAAEAERAAAAARAAAGPGARAGRARRVRLTRKTSRLDVHIQQAPDRFLFNRYEMKASMIITYGRIRQACDYTFSWMKFWGLPIIALYLGVKFCWPAMEVFGLAPWAGNWL